MSRTNRGEKDSSHEYYSRRFPWFLDPGPESKKRTNRLERRQAKDECRLDEPDDKEYPETD